MPTERSLPARSEVALADTWDLKPLFRDDAAWESAFAKLEKKIVGYRRFKGKLGASPQTVRDCLLFDVEVDRVCDRLSTYAHLKMNEDLTDSTYVGFVSRITNLVSRAMEESSYIRPELLALPRTKLERYARSKVLEDFRFNMEKLIRQKPHVLTEGEERLMAMQVESAQAPSKIFEQLNNSDLCFGRLKDADGTEKELTHGTFRYFLESPDRKVRARAFDQYYREYEAHRNTLSATFTASVHQDIFHSRSRRHSSCLDAALFDDAVPRSVYSNLVKTVRANLGAIHEYFDLRRRALGLSDIHHYDTYVPILADLKARYSFEEASDLVLRSLAPLGQEYVETLRKGIDSRWVDRYESKGKRSGAFSSGSYDSPPYILMNFKEDVLDEIFTLAHEAGHSMHSHFSARSQPYQNWSYTIFVAEVASTFNEQLLADYMLSKATDDRMRAFLINREIDAIRGTLVRQTMFADFEWKIHELAEAGEPLTLDRLRTEYRKLLDDYFGPRFIVDPQLELECLRIPHFYRAFYVYKYATGLSAAIALSHRVLHGGEKELEDYLGLLKAGGSCFPLEILKNAGVDMSKPKPIQVAMDHLAARVRELSALLEKLDPRRKAALLAGRRGRSRSRA